MYLGGRYRKLKRGISQSPWLIDGAQKVGALPAAVCRARPGLILDAATRSTQAGLEAAHPADRRPTGTTLLG